MESVSRKTILATVLVASACALASTARACDFNSIDPACGYISQNPANINSPANPANINNPNNPANPNSPFNINNPNNPASPNNPYSGINMTNPYSPYNSTHPESPYSALNPANINNPNNPANPAYLRKQSESEAETEERRHTAHFKNSFLGFFEGEHPVVVYWQGGIERECRLNLDCPRSIYEENGVPAPDRVAGEAEAAPVLAPHRRGHKRRGSDG